MDLATLRRELNLTQEQFAPLIGLRSKGHVSDLERGGKASVKVALAIEALSDGRLRASDFNETIALVERERSAA